MTPQEMADAATAAGFDRNTLEAHLRKQRSTTDLAVAQETREALERKRKAVEQEASLEIRNAIIELDAKIDGLKKATSDEK